MQADYDGLALLLTLPPSPNPNPNVFHEQLGDLESLVAENFKRKVALGLGLGLGLGLRVAHPVGCHLPHRPCGEGHLGVGFGVGVGVGFGFGFGFG